MRGIGDFEGRWSLDRRIEDRMGGQWGRFTGGVRIRRPKPEEGDGAAWRVDESGFLKLGAAAPVSATRTYFWREDGPLIAVEFEDGRPFHVFDPNADRAEAHHDCAPDSYDVRYDFSAWPDWSATWQVRGPRKDYTMVTRYHLFSRPSAKKAGDGPKPAMFTLQRLGRSEE